MYPYYLTGSFIAPGLGSDGSLTPENRFVFLYRPSTYNATLDMALRALRTCYEQAAQTGAPVMESDYDVYHIGNHLLSVSEEQACMIAASSLFFLHIFSRHLDDIPFYRWRYGFANQDFWRDPRCSGERPVTPWSGCCSTRPPKSLPSNT